MNRLKSALGLGISFLITSQIYPFMLSSAFTARTMVKEKRQEADVQKDLAISFILSVVSTLTIAYLLQDGITAIGGVIFAIVLYLVYVWRGKLYV